jgi:hypothetical protein
MKTQPFYDKTKHEAVIKSGREAAAIQNQKLAAQYQVLQTQETDPGTRTYFQRYASYHYADARSYMGFLC